MNKINLYDSREEYDSAAIEEIKARFGELLVQVGPMEISEIEQSLIDEGLPILVVHLQWCGVFMIVFGRV